MTITKSTPRDYSTGFNRLMYGVMWALSVYYLVINHDAGAAMSTLGIGLIFDPFKQEVSWAQRPRYQKAVLLIHVACVFILLAISIINYVN